MADTDYKKEMESLKSDLSQLREDVGNLTVALKEAGAARASEMSDEARQRMQAAASNLSARYDDMRVRGEQAVEPVTREIQERPLTSVLTAFGVGFIIGKLLEKR
jgi:ElaB/YqjD/DUF883 family membrane-anchored ribosome-binding protein